MKKILAVLESDGLQPDLWEAMKSEYDLTFCTSAEDASVLMQKEYDGMILALFLRGTDGLTLLESSQAYAPPVMLVLTSLLSTYIQIGRAHV